MTDEYKVNGNVREEVVLSPKVENESPTRSKQPLKLRFWPTDGKHLNPAVRGVLFAVVLAFLVVMVYGVMSRGGKKKAADAARDDQSISDAQSTGTKVWKDLEEQWKIDARKEAQNQAQPAPSTPDVTQDHVQSAGVPTDLVASSHYSKDALVPPLEARQIAASGRPAQAKPTNTSGRVALNQPQVGTQAEAPQGRSAADELREEMYKSDLEARTAGTSISSGMNASKGLGILGGAPVEGVSSLLQQLAGAYPKSVSAGNAGVPSPSSLSANAGSGDQGDANLQEHKESFIEKARQARDERDYSSATRAPALSKYEIKSGWDIPATLESEVNTDLPGEVKAVVRENVYDTASGQYLLIPQGSRLIGQYDNRVSYGQSRANVVWSRLIFPDGSSVDLDGMVGHDASGAAGFHDQVDNHFVRLVSMALMMSAFTAGVEMSQPQSSSASGVLSPSAAATQALGQQFGQLGMEVTRKNLNIQPTVKIRPGYRFNVRVNRDIAFTEPYGDSRAGE
jgi:type IV secretory pathway VirB10-like protein